MFYFTCISHKVGRLYAGIEAGAETLQQGAKARLGAGASKVTVRPHHLYGLPV